MFILIQPTSIKSTQVAIQGGKLRTKGKSGQFNRHMIQFFASNRTTVRNFTLEGFSGSGSRPRSCFFSFKALLYNKATFLDLRGIAKSDFAFSLAFFKSAAFFSLTARISFLAASKRLLTVSSSF